MHSPGSSSTPVSEEQCLQDSLSSRRKLLKHALFADLQPSELLITPDHMQAFFLLYALYLFTKPLLMATAVPRFLPPAKRPALQQP